MEGGKKNSRDERERERKRKWLGKEEKNKPPLWSGSVKKNGQKNRPKIKGQIEKGGVISADISG